jgi:hypothetical protein
MISRRNILASVLAFPAIGKGKPVTSPVISDPSYVTLGKAVVDVTPGGLGQGSSVLLVNQDSKNNAYVGYSVNISVNGPNTIILPPQAPVVIDSSRKIYGIASPGTIVLVIPGGSNWQASAAQIAAELQPDMQSKSSGVIAPNLAAIIYTAAEDSRVWSVNLFASVAAGAGYAIGVSTYVFVITIGNGSDPILTIVLQTYQTGDQDHDSAVATFAGGGFPLKAGDQVFVSINGGNVVAGATIRGGGAVAYSVP